MRKKAEFSRNEFIKLAGIASLSILGSPVENRLKSFIPSSDPLLPNIVVLVFDAFSALNMSLYGYSRATTPNFARFADRATVFHQHYSTANFTTPGTASLLTGVMPWTHRAMHLQGTTSNSFANRTIFSALTDRYHTFAFTHNSLVDILLNQFGADIDELLKMSDLSRYSDILVDRLPLAEHNIPLEAELLTIKESVNSSLFLSVLDSWKTTAQIDDLNKLYKREFPRGLPGCRPGKFDSYCFTLENSRNWLVRKVQQTAQPFFGYVHLFPPHSPYNPRREFVGIFNDKIDFPEKPEHHFSMKETHYALTRLHRHYDETIAYVDDEFGKLIDALEQAKALDNLCLVITSDHGEIHDRGISYHNTPVLYEPLVRIPLLILYPGQKERRDIYQRTQSIDVLPTMLKLAGVKQPDFIEGKQLSNDNSESNDGDTYLVEAKSCQKFGKLTPATFALIHDHYKLIYYHGYNGFDGVYELYDLQEDPEEIKDLSGTHAALLKDLQELLNQKIKAYI